MKTLGVDNVKNDVKVQRATSVTLRLYKPALNPEKETEELYEVTESPLLN